MSIRTHSKSGEKQPPTIIDTVVIDGSPSLTPNSSAFTDGAVIPDVYAAEQGNISPPLQWTPGPTETKSYAVVVEDPDAPQDLPFVHWIIYNISAEITELDQGIPHTPSLDKPQGALQGSNDSGSNGYFGPRPPKGDPPHHYHLQLFALDNFLNLSHDASRADFVGAIRGHVVAAGELVGTYQR